MRKALFFIVFLNTLFAIKSIAQTWTQQIANYGGPASYGSFAFTINDKGFVGTGYSNAGYRTDLWEYDPALDIWTQKADLPGPGRSGAVGFTIGYLGYAGTGCSLTDSVMADMYEYDWSYNMWTAIAPIPVARVGAAAFSYWQRGYVLTGDHTSSAQHNPSNDVWEYTPTSNTWVQKLDFPAAARTDAFGFLIGGFGYLGGGSTGTSNLNDFWAYDILTDNWYQRSNLPAGVQKTASFVIYVHGFYVTGDTSANTVQMHEYNPWQNTWITRPPFPGNPRNAACGFVVGTEAYVGGGRDGSVFYQDWWEYSDPFLGVAEASADLSVGIYPNPVINTATISIDGNEPGPFTFELYDINGKCLRSETNQHQFLFSREGLGRGVYLYRISTKEGVAASGELLVQ